MITRLCRVAYFFANPLAARATVLVNSPMFTDREGGV